MLGISFLLGFFQNGSEEILVITLLFIAVGGILILVALFGSYCINSSDSNNIEIELEQKNTNDADEELVININYDFLNVEYDNLPDIDIQSIIEEDVWVLKNQKGFNSVEGNRVTYIDSKTQIQKKASIYYNFQAIKIVFYDNTSRCIFKAKYFKYNVVDCISAPFYTVILDEFDSFRFERKKDKDAFVRYFTEYNKFIDNITDNSKENTIQTYSNIVNNPKISNMVKNFLEILDENLFIEFSINRVFVEQYLRKSDLGNLFLQDINLPQFNYVFDRLIFEYQTFSAFNELLRKETNVNNYCVDLLSYLLLQNCVINKYSALWQKKYDCSKGDDEELNEYIYRCFDTNIIDKQDEYGCALLAYYILEQKDNIYDVFGNEILNIQTIVQKVNEKQQKELFEKQIFKDNTADTTDSTISKIKIDDIDMMTGAEFEDFICVLYKKMGYNAYVTKTSGDQGLDVIAERNGKRIGVQAKCYAGAVGNSAIQEAVAGKNYYNCDRVVVVTNSSFTKSAIDLASANNVVLWNRDILKEKINELL